MAQTTTVTKAEVLKLIDGCFSSLAVETEAHVPFFDEPGREVHEQRRMVDERLQELRSQVRTGHFETVVESTAVSLLRNHGFDGECLPPGLMRDLDRLRARHRGVHGSPGLREGAS